VSAVSASSSVEKYHFKNSMAKWKRDAEAFHKENSAMLESHFHTVEANIVCIALLFSLAASRVQFSA
jgi:hypothetical protein